jgi:hypothetical protein
MPSSVIPMLPATCTAIAESAHIIRPAISCATTSTEKVEKVVSPPRKPVTIRRRYSGGSDGWLLK